MKRYWRYQVRYKKKEGGGENIVRVEVPGIFTASSIVNSV